ncbi:MAG TPA: bifunctional DNA-formamidopyrimidine glycosylase/DNA-(apurinic or apyrimidinic site) lyase [Candidatus Limnocylindria bacterium]|nr:bifunctional DNA-formamidopyrimidine glycosylase/DNA-(apurinic or apyrimidinic site) lyase [Candidatus Limnocylindria bacterium]
MPELPEVETVARDLARWVTGARIVDADVRWERTIRHPQPAERFVEEVRDATIASVGRRAKTVLLHLDDGRVLTAALRMTGAFVVAEPGTPEDPHARVVFRLADGRELRFRDPRKFGRIGLWEGGGLRARRGRPRSVAQARAPYRVGDVFARHGPEPMPRSFSAARFADRLRGRRGRLKSLLLDQSFIAGVGNIYADEALWRARLHPLRTADSLSDVEIRRLHRAVRAALREAVTYRGTSFSDYVGADGEPGANAERLRVYRRTGEPCLRCGATIERVVVGQRGTHFCPRCQRLPDEEGSR